MGLTKQYYQKIGQAFTVVFDLSSKLSFDHISLWLAKLSENNPQILEDGLVFLVGNKFDEVNSALPVDLVKSYASANRLKFYQVSAKTQYGLS